MLRIAGEKDLDLMLAWRNHADVRAASFTTHVITREEHRAWWSRVSADDRRVILVFERFEVPSGVVTFTLDADNRAEWGFYLDIVGLEERGEMLPAWLQIEREAVAYALDYLGVDELHGEVIATNEAVMRLHRRHGFHESGRELRDVAGEQVEVISISMLRSDR